MKWPVAVIPFLRMRLWGTDGRLLFAQKDKSQITKRNQHKKVARPENCLRCPLVIVPPVAEDKCVAEALCYIEWDGDKDPEDAGDGQVVMVS